jgi:hypothetical protein
MRLALMLAAFGWFVWQAPVDARMRSETIVPTNTVTAELTFRVSVQDHGNVGFSVMVSPTGQSALSTNITGWLQVQDVDGIIAECPISQIAETNSLTFTFTLHKKLLGESTFRVKSPVTHGGITSGTVYDVKLREFIKQ